MGFHKITILRIERSAGPDVNEQLQQLGAALGLFSLRDKDKSCYRIFVALLTGMRRGEGYTSDELAEVTGLTRGTVVHHLNKLIASGIVDYHKNHYYLTVGNLEELLDKVSRDVVRVLGDLKETAKYIDRNLGLVRR